MLTNCTIVIPTRNRAEDLAETAEHLHAQGLGDTPCVVVDDASDDPATTRRAVAQLANVDVACLPQRRGAAGARNEGLLRTETDYCFFLDDDSHLESPAPLEAFLSNLERDDVAVWRFETIRDADGYRDGIPADTPRTEMHTFLGFGILTDRKRIIEVGGYRDFFLYRHEEDDLAVRVFRAGCRIVYEPGIRVIHRHTAAERHGAEYAFLSARNVLLLYALNWPQPAGLLRGIAKSLSVIVKGRGHKAARIRGCAMGIVMLCRRWQSRTPLSRRQAARYREIRLASTFR